VPASKEKVKTPKFAGGWGAAGAGVGVGVETGGVVAGGVVVLGPVGELPPPQATDRATTIAGTQARNFNMMASIVNDRRRFFCHPFVFNSSLPTNGHIKRSF
jgi:hypothetical protein